MNRNQVAWLSSKDAPDAFPDIESALSQPDGLLAAGGNLGSDRLLAAYVKGIFPWYDEGQPILWWSPNPRCVLRPAELHVARRLRRSMRHSSLIVSFNQSFPDVIRACAGERKSQQGTWITQDMQNAFERLHAEGWAHSIEVWTADRLVGGLYGLSIGKVFFGESMFSAESNASKIALFALCRQLTKNDFALIDCQVTSHHLTTLGAILMPRIEFARILRSACSPATRFAGWPKKSLPIRQLLDL